MQTILVLKVTITHGPNAAKDYDDSCAFLLGATPTDKGKIGLLEYKDVSAIEVDTVLQATTDV